MTVDECHQGWFMVNAVAPLFAIRSRTSLTYCATSTFASSLDRINLSSSSLLYLGLCISSLIRLQDQNNLQTSCKEDSKPYINNINFNKFRNMFLNKHKFYNYKNLEHIPRCRHNPKVHVHQIHDCRVGTGT